MTSLTENALISRKALGTQNLGLIGRLSAVFLPLMAQFLLQYEALLTHDLPSHSLERLIVMFHSEIREKNKNCTSLIRRVSTCLCSTGSRDYIGGPRGSVLCKCITLIPEPKES